ncbi:major capsid protein [Pseudomonas sp. ML96]|uniref:major capsid protein n=1 Tax=Pseudomonas sp. ML96 TaxID=1523503 RepID=UPI0005BA95A9|nr:major capsid protein [Pseudomonas sp. ML96]
MKQRFQTLKRSIGAAAAAGLLMTQQAYAALPEAVETEMATAKTDAVELATLGLLIIIAIAAVKYLRRGV